MTNEEYKPLKPERMSLFQRAVLGIALAGTLAFGGYKTAEYLIDKQPGCIIL